MDGLCLSNEIINNNFKYALSHDINEWDKGRLLISFYIKLKQASWSGHYTLCWANDR